MGDLRDAFKKAGLIDDSEDRRFRHEERVRKKKLGREGLDQERTESRVRGRQRAGERRKEVKAAQAVHDRTRQSKSVLRTVLHAIEAQEVRLAGGGPRRFHFVDRQKGVLYVLVPDDVGRRLEGGELGIVEVPTGPRRVAVVPRSVAAELARVRPDHVLHLGGRGR